MTRPPEQEVVGMPSAGAVDPPVDADRRTGADRRTDAGEVRSEDSFDVEAVASWLRAARPDLPELVGTPEVSQFAGGASNLTFLLGYPTRDLILRRPPAGTKARGAHDMSREYRVQEALAGPFPLVPEMIAFCDEPSVMGCDFYVMAKIEGMIPRADFPKGRTPSRQDAAALCESVVDTLVQLHSVDVTAAGLGDLGRGTGYVQRQVTGWVDRYRKARTPNVGTFDTVIEWIEEHQPADSGQCLIHNDFRLDNLVLDDADPTRVVGVLDWEMATVGDPLMDLGGMLAYWIEGKDDFIFRKFRRQPTHVRGMMTRAEVLRAYCEKTGRVLTPHEWAFYEVFGLFRLAAISQQIYYRYYHKQTTNKAYRTFHSMVLYLDYRCRRLILQADRRAAQQARQDVHRAASRSAAAPGGGGDEAGEDG